MVKITKAVYARDVMIGVRTNSEIKKALQQLAKRDGMTLSDLLNKLAIRELKRQGIEIKVEIEI